MRYTASILFSGIFVYVLSDLTLWVTAQTLLGNILFPFVAGPPAVPALRQPVRDDYLNLSKDDLEKIGVSTEGFPGEERPVRFFLYPDNTDSNYSEEIIPWDKESLAASHYNPNLPLILLTHSFKATDHDERSIDNVVLKDAYLEVKFPANIVGVDWSHFVNRNTRNPDSLPSDYLYYYDVVPSIPQAATLVGDFILFLMQSGVLEGPENIQIVGFSLGGQLAGLVGQDIKNRIGKKIFRITGLDMAGPIFNGQSPDDRLSPDDAEFVEAIHTNQGVYGYMGDTAHVDWYINGGGPAQPGCRLSYQNSLRERCQHERAFYYYADSILGIKYYGCRCKKGKPCLKSKRKCKNALFGQYANTRKRGRFHIDIATNPVSLRNQSLSSHSHHLPSMFVPMFKFFNLMNILMQN